MEDKIPRRFYTGKPRRLKWSARRIAACEWCGTHRLFSEEDPEHPLCQHVCPKEEAWWDGR